MKKLICLLLLMSCQKSPVPAVVTPVPAPIDCVQHCADSCNGYWITDTAPAFGGRACEHLAATTCSPDCCTSISYQCNFGIDNNQVQEWCRLPNSTLRTPIPVRPANYNDQSWTFYNANCTQAAIDAHRPVVEDPPYPQPKAP